MKSKNALCGLAMTVILQLGALAGSAQTNIYLFSGAETNITLPPGTYIITAYGAPGGGSTYYGIGGGLGAEMSAEFNFSASTTLTLLVGGGGGGYYGGGGGGGGSFVVEGNTPLAIAGGGGGFARGSYGYNGENGNISTHGGNVPGGGGGGTGGSGGGFLGGSLGAGGGGFLGNGVGSIAVGGSTGGLSFENGGNGGLGGGGGGGFGGGGGGGYSGGGGGGYSGGGGGSGSVYGYLNGGGGGSIIDSSAIAILAEVSGILSPDDPYSGEIIIIALPPPLAITADGANVVLTWPAAGNNGYTLECATNLVPPVVWQTNSAPLIVIGGQNVIISPISGSQKFFRLH